MDCYLVELATDFRAMVQIKGFAITIVLAVIATASSVDQESKISHGIDSYVAEAHHGHETDELGLEDVGKESHGSSLSEEGRKLRSSRSSNLYAIPYEPGVTVRVNRDHLTHTPKNRIDMSGTSGGSYKIVAAAAGIVKYVQDSYNVNGGCANNNYVWIAHSNGEWTKYSHLAQHSASVNAGIKVGDSVKVGQYIGIEDDIGCASGDHLHWEVAVPDDPSDPIVPSGGYIKGTNLIPRICGISGNLFVAGTSYTVPRVRPGWREYARHGLPHNSFQADFLAASRCGYRMDWNDGYGKGSSALFNVVYHRNENPSLSWRSHRMLTKTGLTEKLTTYSNQGFKLVHIDTYNIGSAVRYATIFKRGASVPQTATYHGVSQATHQSLFNSWTSLGWRPRVISPTSVNGVLYYSAVYTHGSIGSWMAKSYQTPYQYQSNFDANSLAGRRLIYLNSYVHNGQARYSAIWASTAKPNVFAKHGLSSAAYQAHFNYRVRNGWTTAAVSGMYIGGTTYFAAFWDK